MKVKLENPSLISRAIEIISELVTEVRIKVNDFGMSITAMDPANVAMVNFKVPKSAFTEFEVGQENLGVNLDDLKRILKRCGGKSSLIIERKENVLNFQIQDRIARNFNLTLIDVDSEEKEMPNLEFSAKVELTSVDFVDVVEDCAVVSDSVSFVTSEGNFIIKAGRVNSTRAEFSGDVASIEAEDAKSKYSLEYLQKFLKAAKICEKTLIRFASDHPLRLDFKTEGMELSFILAPRVETED